MAWLHAKYEITAILDTLIVELNVPGNLHKRFHVDLIKLAGNDPFKSQVRDDAQNLLIVVELNEHEFEFEFEFEVESILRVRSIKRAKYT